MRLRAGPQPFTFDLHAYYDQVKAEARARHKTYDEGQRAMREMRVMGWKDTASPPDPLCRAMSLPGPSDKGMGAMLTPARRAGI